MGGLLRKAWVWGSECALCIVRPVLRRTLAPKPSQSWLIRSMAATVAEDAAPLRSSLPWGRTADARLI